MYQVVGVEDDEDLVFRREAVKSELERGYLIVEREGGRQDMYPRVGEMELPVVAVIGNDIDIEMRV